MLKLWQGGEVVSQEPQEIPQGEAAHQAEQLASMACETAEQLSSLAWEAATGQLGAPSVAEATAKLKDWQAGRRQEGRSLRPHESQLVKKAKKLLHQGRATRQEPSPLAARLERLERLRKDWHQIKAQKLQPGAVQVSD